MHSCLTKLATYCNFTIKEVLVDPTMRLLLTLFLVVPNFSVYFHCGTVCPLTVDVGLLKIVTVFRLVVFFVGFRKNIIMGEKFCQQ